MAKKQNDAAAVEVDVDTLDPKEWKDYAARCCSKQCGIPLADAEKRVGKLSEAKIAEIREAGRTGDVARVRELLNADKGEQPKE